jgi:nitrate reductase gamma subunit
MDAWIAFARGPLPAFSLVVLLLGSLRLVVLLAVEIVRAYKKAGDQAIPWSWMFRRSLGWIVPVNALRGTRVAFTLASVVFHLGVFSVPLFLAGHVAIVRKEFGVGWPTLLPGLADALTLAACAALAALLALRFSDRGSRFMSTFQDWFLPALCLVAFLSGYLVAHPEASSLPFGPLYLGHLLSSCMILILLPFTKLAHAPLFPFTRITWELGWHFVPGAGEKVRIALGKEGEPV